jgi:seryl-tRNA synthetase
MNSTLVHQHLKKYTQEAMKQKFRLDQTIEDYEKLDIKLRERIIDQNDLIQEIESLNHSQTQIDTLTDRKLKDEKLREDIQSIIQELKNQKQNIVNELQQHLLELSELEIQLGGFVTHTVVVDHATKFDEDTKIIEFKEKGHAEIPIATYLEHWKDSSQLRILPK